MAVKKSGMYASLWGNCDELRGGMDTSQYRDYVLVLLFVKYVSDKYQNVTLSECRSRWLSAPATIKYQPFLKKGADFLPPFPPANLLQGSSKNDPSNHPVRLTDWSSATAKVSGWETETRPGRLS